MVERGGLWPSGSRFASAILVELKVVLRWGHLDFAPPVESEE